jgi:hypothetical protein
MRTGVSAALPRRPSVPFSGNSSGHVHSPPHTGFAVVAGDELDACRLEGSADCQDGSRITASRHLDPADRVRRILAALASSRLLQWRAARAITPCAVTTGFPSRESRAIQRAWHRAVSRIPARTPKDDLPLKMTACEINQRGALVARPTTIISRQGGGTALRQNRSDSGNIYIYDAEHQVSKDLTY